jgi:hypothetical protein
MVGAVVVLSMVTPFELFSESGSWLSLATKVLVGGVVYGCVLGVTWRLEGRPAGIEQRVLQVLSPRPGAGRG